MREGPSPPQPPLDEAGGTFLQALMHSRPVVADGGFVTGTATTGRLRLGFILLYPLFPHELQRHTVPACHALAPIALAASGSS